MSYFIKNYVIEKILYSDPADFFDSIERTYMPSFLTGDGPEDISKESIIGIKPYINININNNHLWEELRQLNNMTNFHKFDYPINRLGAIGFLSYEALHTIENIKKGTINNYTLPLLNWTLYNEYYYFDHGNREAFKIQLNYENFNQIEGPCHEDIGFKVTNLTSDYSPEKYKENVKKIIDLIYDGEVYEVNLTQAIQGDFSGSPYSLFKKMYHENSAPYSAYLHRDEYSIVSSSPELFLKVENKEVETRPIKGTIARSSNDTADFENKKILYNSPKNQAELFMIIDLLRNDLSKVCNVGSVKVLNKKRIEKYKNVYHLVGIITGELSQEHDIIDLIKATFPGGSITGCPKVRCMEITEQIEKSSRNIYTGSIFLMNQARLNSSIVIRSAVIKDDKIFLNSGGAITIDSDPEEEYNESLVKLKSIFKVVEYENNF